MFKINVALTLAGLLLAAQSLHAQTLTLVTDNFDSGGAYNGLSGRTTDTGNVQWISQDFSTVPQTWGSGLVVADYSGNDARAIALPLSSFTLRAVTTVSALLYSNNGSQVAFGFSGTAPGTYEANVGSLGGGGNKQQYLAFLNQANGLAIILNQDGSGSLNYSGGSIANFATPAGFTAGAPNSASLSFNSSADTVSVSLAGVSVVSNFDLSFFTTTFAPNYAGFAENYGQGWNGNGTNATGFDNFAVTTSAAVPEPSTYAAGLIGLGGLMIVLRKRSKLARV